MFNSKTYKKYLLLFIFATILPTLLVYVSTYSLMSERIMQQAKNSEENDLVSFMDKIDGTLSNVTINAVQLSKQQDKYNSMFSDFRQMSFVDIKNIINSLNNVKSGNSFVNSVYLSNNESTSIITDSGIMDYWSFYDTDWSRDYIKIIGETQNEYPIWLNNRTINRGFENVKVVSFIMPYPYNNEVKKGYIVINIDINKLAKFYNASNNKSIHIISNDGESIFGEDINNIDDILNGKIKKLEGKNITPFYVQSHEYGWKFINIVSEQEIFKPLEPLKFNLLFFLLIDILIAIIISIVASNKMYKPIRELMEAFKEITHVTKDSSDEFEFMKTSVKQYESNRMTIENELNYNKMLADANVLRKILRGEFDKDFVSRLFPHSSYGYVVISYRNSDENLKNKEFHSLILEMLSECGLIYKVAYISEVLTSAIFMLNQEKLDNIYKKNKEIIDELAWDFSGITVGIGTVVLSESELKNSYLKSIQAIKYKFFNEDEQVFVYEDNKLNNAQYPVDLENEIVEAVVSRNIELIEEKIKEFIGKVMNLKTDPEKAHLWIRNLNENIFNIPNSLGYQPDEIFFREYQTLYDKLKNQTSIFRIQAYLFEICINIVQGLNVRLKNKSKELVIDIKQHIKDNISGDMSLNNVSKIYGISPSYLSTLFKQETGGNYHNFVNDIKMQYAISLITETDLKIGEIAQKVGYTSENSFFSVFKKHTGYTPRQYKDINK